MQAYRLSEPIEIEKETTELNEQGTVIESFSKLKSCFATVTYFGGRTRVSDYGEAAESDAYFTIRYDSRINYKCRIKYRNKYYKILHIEYIGRNEGIRFKTILFEDEEI